MYAYIESIEAPAQTAPGSLVTVTVSLRNYGEGGYLAATGLVTGKNTGISFGITFLPGYQWHGPDITQDYTATFTMPNEPVFISVESWHWDGYQWVPDEIKWADIGIPVVVGPAEFRALSAVFNG